MITNEIALKLGHEWVAAWNAHDLDAVLAHYTDDFTIKTPIAAVMVPGSNGIVKGKPAVRAYWEYALTQVPDLHFVLEDILAGIDGITIYYRNTATKRRSAEVLTLNEDGKVVAAAVYYAG